MLRVKKLDIFIVKQFSLLFAGTFFICLFVLMMQFLWRYVDELIGKGLSMEILAQFFGYMALMLVPQALPLAILLSSLIAYGNLGESSELTAIKAAGISLIQSFRALIVISVIIAIGSFYFQNNIGPTSQMKIAQLMISIKQKNPEKVIEPGIFNNDIIPNCNIYVGKKNSITGKLYDVMVYRMTDSYEDAAIILADSGMVQSTAEKKHIALNLWSGEWFENIREQELVGSASVPYRRESFIHRKLVLDFDGGFNLTDAAGLANDARTKSIAQLNTGIDSLNHVYDSIGNAYYKDAKQIFIKTPELKKTEQKKAENLAKTASYDFDSLYAHFSPEQKRTIVTTALNTVQQEVSDLEFKSMITSDGDKMIRQHKIERINKFTLALTCIIFFFIGAPLGAIIRKGGLGVPIIVSVLVFIVYYILDNTGYRMARQGSWAIWFGKGLSPAVLIPLAIFFTYKANNDSAVFNPDAYKNFFMKLFGLRIKRHIASKEVIIEDPHYLADAENLTRISRDITTYSKVHSLKSPPNFVQVFFKYKPDHEIERIEKELENIIEDLSNTRNKVIMTEINKYPILATKAHTRPFELRWANILSAIIVPIGLFLYFRMWRFRLRLNRDLKTVTQANMAIIGEINRIYNK